MRELLLISPLMWTVCSNLVCNSFRTFGPDFIACIWIRRVDGADNSDARFAEAFQGVPQDRFRIFSDEDIPSLEGIDVKGGKC